MPLQYFTKEYNEKCRPPVPDITQKKPKTEKEPGSDIFTIESDPNDLSILYRDIKLLTSSSLVFELAAFARKLQPDIIVIGNEVTINITLLREENRPSMRKFVTYLLKKAATGDIDAYSRPFGRKISPIHIYERGFPSASQSTIVSTK